MQKEIIGNCTLYLGDMLEIMPDLQGYDAIVTDPPYGLGKKMQGGTWGAQEHNEGFLKWDTEARQEWIDAILAAGLPSVIWGGNYYDVPASRCWLIWSKVNAVPTMADFEMAWTNFDRPAKRIDLPVGRVEFGHPTQKPLALMLFCLQFVKASPTILDPFTGSVTTGVACVREGKSFIGIEKDPAYFELACRRIEDAYRQPDLFVAPTEMVQRQEVMAL